MVRHAHLFVVLALVLAGGCAPAGDARGPEFDPWASRWDGRDEAPPVPMTRTTVAWPTGDPATADVSVEKVFPADPRPGRPFDGRLVITNLTGMTLADLVITERLGPGFALTASSPQGRSSQSGVYRWDLGVVGPGQSRTIRVMGRVDRRGPITSSTSARYTPLAGAGRDG